MSTVTEQLDLGGFVTEHLGSFVPLIAPNRKPKIIISETAEELESEDIFYTPHLMLREEGADVDNGEAFFVNLPLLRQILQLPSEIVPRDPMHIYISRTLCAVYVTLRYFALENSDVWRSHLLTERDFLGWITEHDEFIGQHTEFLISAARHHLTGMDLQRQIDAVMLAGTACVLTNCSVRWNITMGQLAKLFTMKSDEIKDFIGRGFYSHH